MRAFAAALLVAGGAAAEDEGFASLHFQATVATQAHPSFSAAYSGTNRMRAGAESATSVVMDLIGTVRPWAGAELTLQPELAGGRGLSSTLGVAAFPSGEVYRVGNPEPGLIIGRAFLKQVLGPVALTAGKFWGLWASAAYDYPADTRGYTWGLAAEATFDACSARAGLFLEPKFANGIAMEWNLATARGLVAEVERRWSGGALRLLGFLNTAHMGNYAEATGQHLDVVATHRDYLAGGGYGFLIGDGALDYAPEILGELYYRAQLTREVSLGANYQPILHPGYNQDRGPIHVFTARAHVAF